MKIQVRGLLTPDAPWHDITEQRLAEYCVNCTGGGYNQDQVADAMLLQREILGLPAGETWKSPSGKLEMRIES